MEAKHHFTTWQEYLSQLIKNPQEKRRLAQEARVRPITLERWAEGRSQPREENLRRLARVLPSNHASAFLKLVENAFPSLGHEQFDYSQLVAEIPPDFYAQALQLYARMPANLAPQKLLELILKRAVEQFDPDRVGISVVLVCCVPPRQGEKIRALRQIDGVATPPWEPDQGKKPLFLGAESMAGNAVMTYRMSESESRDSGSFIQAHWTEFEQSAIAYPILRQAKIAGALVVSSCKPYFFTVTHKNLLELYAALAVLVFQASDFYDISEIKLGIMPDQAIQEQVYHNFGQRVIEKSQQFGNTLSNLQIRQSVWQDIVDELLNLPRTELGKDLV